MREKITIIIVNYNAGEDLLTCLRSVYESQMNPMIVVVDNGSRDGSLERCKDAYPKAHYIINSRNVGFASGVNIGVRFALERGTSKVVLLNPDAVLGRDCLSLICKALDDTTIGIAAPLIYKTQDKTLWFAGGRVNFKKQRVEHHTSIPTRKDPQDTEFITGCVMAIHARAFQLVELFDEQFFLYYEDADFTRRTQDAGLRTVVVSEAVAWHAEKSSNNPDSKTYHLVLSGLLFFYKHGSRVQKLRSRAVTVLRRVSCDVRVLFSGDEHSKNLQNAFKDFNDIKKQAKATPINSHRPL